MSSNYQNNQRKDIRSPQYQQYPPTPNGQPYYPGQFYPEQPSAFPANKRNSSPQPKPQRTPPMPKVQALELAEKFKQGIIVVSFLGFGVLSALVISNMPATASTNTNQATPTQSTDPSSTPSSGGVLQQQQGGYGFGASPTPQNPVSGSHGS